jgi:glycosyltransferase involved in cell wall biosynthesis
VSDPVFSVVMPAFNSAPTIGDAVLSVLGQTYSELELVVVDDGSSDATADVVDSFRDPRIRLLRQENRGAAAARNTAIGAARGPLVAFIDSDDLWLPEFLERMHERFDEIEELALCYTDAWVLDPRSGRIGTATAMEWQRPPADPPEDPAAFLLELLDRNFIFTATVVRKSVFDEIGVFDPELRAAIDYEMWLRVAARGYRIASLPGLHAVYRRDRPGSISSNRAGTFRSLTRVYERFAADASLASAARELAQARLEVVQRELAALEGATTLDGLWRARLRPLLVRGRNAVLRVDGWRDTPPAEVERLLASLSEARAARQR